MSKDTLAYPGDIAPKDAGVYIVTTDSASHFGFFLGYFNGQYWYEYTRADHGQNPRSVPRKKSARLAVTAWMHINHRAFGAALLQERRAPTDLRGRCHLAMEVGW